MFFLWSMTCSRSGRTTSPHTRNWLHNMIWMPLYLTKNGRGCYTVMNIDEQEEQREKAEKYDRMQAQLRLMCELAEGRRSGEEEGWISSEDVRNHFRARANAK